MRRRTWRGPARKSRPRAWPRNWRNWGCCSRQSLRAIARVKTVEPPGGRPVDWGNQQRRCAMDPRTDNGLRARDLDPRETGNLIGSDKVEGTAVYGPGEEKIGSIERVMIDKPSGKVAYAVLSFGGFLGIGDDHYPIPWAKLTYDESLGGYRTDISREDLDAAPRYE